MSDNQTQIVELDERESDWVFWPGSGEPIDTGGVCNCGHEGLRPDWHLSGCPGVAFAWKARAKELHDALWDLKARQQHGFSSLVPPQAVATLRQFYELVGGGKHKMEPGYDVWRAQLDWYMHALKRNGYTLEAIAAPLGITREAVRIRIKKAHFIDGVPEAPSPPPPPVIEPSPAPPPRPEIPVDSRNRLVDLQKNATRLRGKMGPHHPARRASEELSALIWDLLEGGFTLREIAEPLGVGYRSVHARLRSHGYLAQYPSQQSYQGALAN